MKKRIIASTLVLMLCLSLLPYEVFANLQSPIQGISVDSIVGHTKEMDQIRPKVELMFAQPIPLKQDDTTSGSVNGTGLHGLEDYYYQVDIKEHPTGKNFKYPESPRQLKEQWGIEPEPAENTLTNGIPVQGLDNGRLYKMSIIPSHYHQYEDSEGNRLPDKWAPRTGVAHPFEYVLTDFDTRMEGKGGSIEVTWEDAGSADIDYQIGYIQGNYEGQSLNQIKNNNTVNNINYISPGDIKTHAKTYRDPQTKRTRFRYTIEDDIAVGQMYSAYVVSTTERIDNKIILKNRETPKVVTATTEIGLNVYNVGKDKIRLEWDPKLFHVTDGEYNLVQTQIKEYNVGQESGRVIATLYGKDGVDIGYYEYREPKISTYYQLILIYEHKATGQPLKPEPQTARVLYVPGELRTKPTTPEIPKPIGPNTTVTASNKGEFLVPEDLLADVSLIDLWKNNHTFHVNMVSPPSLNLVWSSYKEDLSLLYDIWVTDDMDMVTSETEPIIKDLSFSSGQNEEDILYSRGQEEIVGFKHTIGEYYDSQMQRRLLVPNRVYYVKIIAKKKYGDELEPSLPAIVAIMFNSDGEIFAPPIISKPPLKIEAESISPTSITIEWLETWYEIMAQDFTTYPVEEQEKAKEWHAKVYTGVTTGAAISFIHKEGAREHILKREQNIEIVKDIIGKKKYKDNYLNRVVNLGKNAEYEYKFTPYEEILKGLESYNATTINGRTIEKYIEMLMGNETDPDQDYGWKKITPKTAEDDEYTQWKQHTQGNLKPNTSYVFFVKPYAYDYDGTKLQAALPTWIVGTTLPDGEMPEGKPTVPVLSLNGKGDTHISVEWEYNSAFDYEIRYSRLEDPDKATPWPFEIGTEVGDPTYVEHGGKAVVTIDGLFPDTTYNVWIRAKQKKGQQISAWSNPVTTKTDLLGAPSSPAGLGIAGYQSILEVGRDFKPVDSNHITVEWERNGPDKDLDDLTQDSQRVQKEYRYVIEIADNPEFLDVKKVDVGKDTVGKAEENAEILSRSMVYFEGLIANRPYYIRAKTVLIAHDKENNREIILESDYTQFVRIITKPSQYEYDGGDKVNEVIYPNKIEETYDGTTWTYEILDTQKVINEMVTGNQFKYVVPVQKYRDRYDPKYRLIKIPQPVIQTLINRRMELEIRTNILNIQIPSGALKASLIGSTSKDMIEFTFETLSESDLYGIDMGYQYKLLSTPEKMGIMLKGQKGLIPITRVDELMKLRINMPHQHDYMYKNLGGYSYDNSNGIWKKGNHTFDKVSMQLAYTIGTVGTYAAYELSRQPVYTTDMSPSMEQVALGYDILGLGTKYTQNTQMNKREYINIMLGIAEKRLQIIADVGPTESEQGRAQKAGLYQGNINSALTQEAAINGIIKLYELTNGMPIRPDKSRNLNYVSPNYRDNIHKAYTIGLIDSIRPGQPVTYKEFFDLIEQVIE